eukprot:363217-Chlamydomonas_euryale.AAC.9
MVSHTGRAPLAASLAAAAVAKMECARGCGGRQGAARGCSDQPPSPSLHRQCSLALTSRRAGRRWSPNAKPACSRVP